MHAVDQTSRFTVMVLESEAVFGMKREHGEAEPAGAKSVTAPATVSGERP